MMLTIRITFSKIVGLLVVTVYKWFWMILCKNFFVRGSVYKVGMLITIEPIENKRVAIKIE
jgi:hypothetical protein